MRWSIRGCGWNDEDRAGGGAGISAAEWAGSGRGRVVAGAGSGGGAVDRAVQSYGAEFAGAADGAYGAALDGDRRIGARHFVADYFRDPGFDAGEHLRGVWRGDHRADDWGGGRLFRRVAGSLGEYRADQRVFVLPGDLAGHCV